MKPHPEPRLRDQRYTNAYLFGASCPRSGKGAASCSGLRQHPFMQMSILDEILLVSNVATGRPIRASS